MRQIFIFASILALLTACSPPPGKEAGAPREEEKARSFSENWDQDQKELGDQVSKDYKELRDQAEKDGEQVGENWGKVGNRMANNMRDNIKRTGERIRKWWITPLPENKRLAIANSYCYNVLQDVLCYRQPMPGWEHRLVGYQGTAAVPPPPAMMKPLPTRAMDEKHQPENRVANADPVFKEVPEDSKEKEKEQPSSLEAPPAEAAHETLPDPALAPQL